MAGRFSGLETGCRGFRAFRRSRRIQSCWRVKGRWALYGLILGILFHASDIAFEWRGEPFHSWNGHEFENIDRAAASLLIPAFLFFLAGTIKDIFFSRWKIRAAVAEAAQQVVSGPTERGYANFIARNWRGEYSLAVSYWVFGLIGNFAVALIFLA